MTVRTTCPNCRTNFNLIGPGYEEGKAEIVEKVLALWNQEGGWTSSAGWIPGAAYKELAKVLGVDVDRLYHWDAETKTHHDPVREIRS